MSGVIVSRQALYDEIWSISASKVAEKYELSYPAFLKICKENKIPVPPSGYWTKLKFGKPVEKIPLPASDKETLELIAEKGRSKDTDQIIAQQTTVVPEEERIELEIKTVAQARQLKREALYREVWAEPITAVSKRRGISDNALRKICRDLDIPIPPRGYWAKTRAGKEVDKTELPKPKEEKPPKEDRPKTGEQRKLHVDASALSFLQDEDRRNIMEAAGTLRVGGPGAALHKDIAAQKEKCESWLERQKERVRVGYSYRSRYVEETPALAEDISKESYSRAFHILDALLKGMLPFGASVTHQFHFRVNGEDVPFTMSEGKDQTPHVITQEEKMALLKYEEERRRYDWASKPNIRKWDHPWNGKLTLTLNGKFKFMDCKAYSLEDRIGEIMIAFYEASYQVRVKRLEEEEKRRKQEEERKKEEARREQYNKEVDYTEGLINEAEDYATACKIRVYITAMKASGTASADWLEWANAKADWLDPTLRVKDPFFGSRNHAEDPEKKKPKKKGYYW